MVNKRIIATAIASAMASPARIIDRHFRFIKPSGKKFNGGNSKYKPHQGKQECARRIRQAKKLKAKRSLALAA